jgi:hypothetical protein
MPLCTDRRAFAQQAHAEAHAILALRDAHTRLLNLRSVDEALENIAQDIACRAGRLGRSPDAICDDLEAARLEQVAAAARMAGAATEGAA